MFSSIWEVRGVEGLGPKGLYGGTFVLENLTAVNEYGR